MSEMSNSNSTSHEVCRLLVVDDEPPVRRLARRWLEREGHKCCEAGTAEEAWQLLQERNVRVLVSDLNLPGASGLDLLRRTREEFGDSVAVLVMTGFADRQLGLECVSLGAYGYLSKPVERDDLVLSVAAALQRRRVALDSQALQRKLEAEVRQRALAPTRREEEIIWRLLWAAECRDSKTSDHVRRIGVYARVLAEAVGWMPERLDDVELAAAMHDVGKVGVPDSILNKPGPLTPHERKVVERHTVIGAEILGNSNVELLQLAEQIALTHHERWDGTGYPFGHSGTDIPMAGRLVAIVDVYDALGSDRPFRARFPHAEVMERMRAGRGSHFDPDLLDVFLRVEPDLRWQASAPPSAGS